MLKRFLAMAAGGALVLGLALGGAQANAQPGPSDKDHKHGRERMSPDQQLERLSKTLNLTDDQKGQIKPVLADRHQKMESIRADSSLSREDRMSKMRGIFEDSNSKIRAVLNDDQKKQFDEMQQRRRERMEKHSEGEKK